MVVAGFEKSSGLFCLGTSKSRLSTPSQLEGENTFQEGLQMWFDVQTWLPIVTVTLAAAICLSVASFIMGSTKLPPVGA